MKTVIAAALFALFSAVSFIAPSAAASPKHDASTMPTSYQDAHFDYFVSGDPRLPRAKRTDFLLALFGGGGQVDAGFRAIAKHAGGGHIVILRAVSDGHHDPQAGDYNDDFREHWGPVVSAETIVFHDREASSDPRVLAAIRGADGIFLAGGDQANYVRYWKGTPVQDALDEHVRKQRPIGGSSAGLAILGRYAYTALDGGSMESKTALADPFDAGMTIENDFLHFRGLEHAITDTHFGKRARLGRLIAFIARIDDADPRADAFGIGVDEKTALLIDAKGKGRLTEDSHGSAWLVQLPPSAKRLVAGKPLDVGNVSVTRIGPGSSLDLATRQVTTPAGTTQVAIRGGKPDANTLVGDLLSREVTPPGES